MVRRVFVVFLILAAALAAGWLALRRSDIPYDSLEARYANEHSQFLTLQNGLIVHYRDEGDRDAPVIVLLHGFASSIHTWDEWAERLRQDYRIVRFDLPGHGLTRVTDETDLSTAGLVSFVNSVTSTLGLDEFVLVGSSMGGHTAWRYALEHQDQLKGLALLAAAGLPEDAENENTPLVFKLIQNPVTGPLMKDLDIKPLIRNGIEDSFFDQSFVTEEMIDRYADLARGPGHRAALLSLATRQDLRATQKAQQLKTLTVPTLIMFGDSDNLVPPSFGPRYVDLIDRSELIAYPNVGHLPQEEVAEQSVADFMAFLSGLDLDTMSESGASGEAVMQTEGVPLD